MALSGRAARVASSRSCLGVNAGRLAKSTSYRTFLLFKPAPFLFRGDAGRNYADHLDLNPILVVVADGMRDQNQAFCLGHSDCLPQILMVLHAKAAGSVGRCQLG
jgi:hypothetical protein